MVTPATYPSIRCLPCLAATVKLATPVAHVMMPNPAIDACGPRQTSLVVNDNTVYIILLPDLPKRPTGANIPAGKGLEG